jgi:hypothetical protein
MGRRAIDPALQLSRTIGLSVLEREHETWLNLPMPVRRRISTLLRATLRQELGLGDDVREDLGSVPARGRTAAAKPSRPRTSRAAEPVVVAPPPTAERFQPAPVPAPVRPAPDPHPAAADPGVGAGVAPSPQQEPDLATDGWF